MEFKNGFSTRFKLLQKYAGKYSYPAAWVMVVISLTLTIWLWHIIKEETYLNASVRFEFSVQGSLNSIKKRLTAYEQVLLGANGLFAATENVTRHEWKSYVDKLKIEQNYPGILGIGFTKVILPSEKDDFIKSVRKEGFKDFWIWPEGNRDVYTSIVYLEPFKGRNLRAFGYDMFTNPVREAAMRQAMDKGITTISGKVKLVQETDKDVQSGFLMYVPLYKNNLPTETVEQKRKAIFGYVYSPFRMVDLMNGILGMQKNSLHLFIFDGENQSPESLMYNSIPNDSLVNINKSSLFNTTKKINFNGHQWTLRFASLPDFNNTVDKEKPLIVLIAGSVITLLFFTVAMSLTATRKLFKKTEQILESTGEGIFGIDLKGNCTFINKSAVEMIGFDPVNSNKKIHFLIHHSHVDGSEYRFDECPIFNSLKNKKGCIRDDEVFWKEDGTSFPVQYSAFPIIEQGDVKGGVVTFIDITERKKSEKIIEDSLKEKDILLREIHHRVKNNMQIISSLLNLQSSYIQDKQVSDVFRESQNRIRSMALIHEKLYQSGNLGGVKLNDYVKDLARHLMTSYNYGSAKIELKTDIENISLGIDTAISVGLIINELLSNALKYAFTNGSNGEIKITYKAMNYNYSILSVGDTGKGFPEHINFKQTETLGLQLVNTLVDQLDGTIELCRNNGTEFKITLPYFSK